MSSRTITSPLPPQRKSARKWLRCSLAMLPVFSKPGPQSVAACTSPYSMGTLCQCVWAWLTLGHSGPGRAALNKYWLHGLCATFGEFHRILIDCDDKGECLYFILLGQLSQRQAKCLARPQNKISTKQRTWRVATTPWTFKGRNKLGNKWMNKNYNEIYQEKGTFLSSPLFGEI